MLLQKSQHNQSSICMPIDYIAQQKYNIEHEGNSLEPIITRKKKMELMEVYKDNNSRESIHISKFNKGKVNTLCYANANN